MFRLLSLLALSVLALAAPLRARDAYVLFSGGGTPLTNNYSQYLQAKAMAAFLQGTYPADSVWVFFGIGNREGEAPILADVRRQVKKDGQILESWVPGPLPRNRPATKAEFLGALKNEVLPAVRDGGTLYLFVGDHGTQAKEDPKESLITMWQLKRDGERGWRTDPKEELGVTELQAVLAEGLGQGKVVFCMTQCHSGGFHHLGVPRTVAPSQAWFEGMVPEWAAPIEAAPLPAVAGVTATDEDSLAAGCDPDPDPDRWAGYERFVPEALLGLDLFSGAREGAGLPSFADAHVAAVLVDQTIDKPRRSSDLYLERWATLIERLAGEKPEHLTPKARKALAAYQKAVDSGLAKGSGRAFKARRAEFETFIKRMGEQNKSAAIFLRAGPRDTLQKNIGDRPEGRPSAPSGSATARRNPPPAAVAWKDTVRPAWKAAVEAGQIEGLTDAALTFEKYLLAQEERGRDVMFPRGWQNPMLNDLFWQSGYAFPDKVDPVKAEAVVRWGAERRAKLAAWAAASTDEKIRTAAAQIAPRRPANAVAALPPPRTLSAKIAAERTLFYRRTIAAWAFLQAMGEKSALQEVERLTALEQTPLPGRRG